MISRSMKILAWVKSCQSTASSLEAPSTPIGVDSEKGHKEYLKTAAPLLGRPAEGIAVAQPGEEKAPGNLTTALQYLNGSYKKVGGGCVVTAQQGMASDWK